MDKLQIKLTTWLFLIPILIVSCRTDSFKDSCLKTSRILNDAMKLISVKSVENIYNDKNEISGTVWKQDISKARKYLISKEHELYKYYEIIKEDFKKNTDNPQDALFVLAYLNDFLNS